LLTSSIAGEFGTIATFYLVYKRKCIQADRTGLRNAVISPSLFWVVMAL
jgi:hypothetical protein